MDPKYRSRKTLNRSMADISRAQPVVAKAISPRSPKATSLPPESAAGRGKLKAAAASGRRKQRISKTIVNFVLDTLLLVLVITLLFMAAVLRFVFPAPTLSAGWTLWGYGYDAWSNFEFVLVAVFGLAILLHVMLHWAWVCGVLVSKVLRRAGPNQMLDEGQQTLLGVGLLIVVVNILGGLIGLAYLTIQSPAG
jgi:hypothetical protein